MIQLYVMAWLICGALWAAWNLESQFGRKAMDNLLAKYNVAIAMIPVLLAVLLWPIGIAASGAYWTARRFLRRRDRA